MDLLSPNNISTFILFLLPGFISIKIWSLLVASDNGNVSDRLMEVATYGCLNLLVVQFLLRLTIAYLPALEGLVVAVGLFGLPFAWPFLMRWVLNWKCLKGRIVHPTPKAWDHVFSNGGESFVLVHLKNGNLICGLYGDGSFASSCPFPEDIYLSEVWYVKEGGLPARKIPYTKGMWICKDGFDYLEFLAIPREEVSDQDERSRQDTPQ